MPHIFLLQDEQVSAMKDSEGFHISRKERKVMELNRMDYVILVLLDRQECKSFYKGKTLQEIIKTVPVARVTAYRKMLSLCKLGYVDKGCKSANADTYFITAQGIEMLREGKEQEND